MEIQITTVIDKLEESLFGLSNQTNKVMEEKIQQLMSVLSRIGIWNQVQFSIVIK